MKARTAKSLTAALAVAFVGYSAPSAEAAPINYGDFVGSSVMYLDVTETANTPGDSEPLLGAPSVTGNTLDFDPAGFTATATGGAADITDAQLNFILMGAPDAAISSITFSERGDYSLLGAGSAATQAIFGLSIASITVLEVDGFALSDPIALAASSASGGDDLSSGVDVLTPWSLGLTYDVNAALIAASVEFLVGATKLEVAVDDMLAVISEPSTLAFIAKKDFRVSAETEPLTAPEPTSLALLGFALCGLGLARRRRA